MRLKKISAQAILGQQGVNLVERRILEMGCLWHPTGGVEAGIDGFIELRNPETGEVTGSQLALQSKATAGVFQGETSERFEFLCRQVDLD